MQLSQSINELLWNENYLLQEKLIMLTQLPFHKDKDFKHFNFFMQMLNVSIIYICGCVEYLIYQSQGRVPNISSPV